MYAIGKDSFKMLAITSKGEYFVLQSVQKVPKIN